MTTASVIVCTHDRVARLQRCIESVATQRRSVTDVEIVVVDNASTDLTAATVRRLQRQVPGLRAAHEPILGLSRARNHAIRIARGDVLLFVDDDATPCDGWLDAMLDAAARPEAAAVAGRVVLDPAVTRPWWFVPEVEPLYSGFDLGETPRLLSAREWPFGTNMAVRRDVAVRLGGFPEELGRVGASLLSAEETALFERLTRSGMRIAYEPRAVVVHDLARERLTLRHLARRAYAQGRSEARLHDLLAADGGSWFDGRASSAFVRATMRGWRRCFVGLADADQRTSVLVQELTLRSAALGFAIERRRCTDVRVALETSDGCVA